MQNIETKRNTQLGADSTQAIKNHINSTQHAKRKSSLTAGLPPTPPPRSPPSYNREQKTISRPTNNMKETERHVKDSLITEFSCLQKTSQTTLKPAI